MLASQLERDWLLHKRKQQHQRAESINQLSINCIPSPSNDKSGQQLQALAHALQVAVVLRSS
jgi:hypothetical protein